MRRSFTESNTERRLALTPGERFIVWLLTLLFLIPAGANAQDPEDPEAIVNAELLVPVSLPDSTSVQPTATVTTPDGDDLLEAVLAESPYGLSQKRDFNPDPTRAVWMSALFPGLGQIYNRRYWKLPIVVAGFLGLGYATSWNNTQYQDYSQAYRDLMDSDPDTKSYMNFFPPTTSEADLDKSWLSNTMRSRKDFYRRNRDLCIICVVALYLLCMVDAYVDASLAHFDVSDNLSMDVQPALFVAPNRRPALGLNWALTF